MIDNPRYEMFKNEIIKDIVKVERHNINMQYPITFSILAINTNK